MAQLLRHDEIQSKDKKESLVRSVFVSAKELSYKDPESWKFTDDSAELIRGKILDVDGKYEARNLERGLNYNVTFEVLLKNSLIMASPVKITLILPDQTIQVSDENLMDKPRNKIIQLKVGQFTNKFMFVGDIKFSLSGTETTTLKQGLVVKGVHIDSDEN